MKIHTPYGYSKFVYVFERQIGGVKPLPGSYYKLAYPVTPVLLSGAYPELQHEKRSFSHWKRSLFEINRQAITNRLIPPPLTIF